MDISPLTIALILLALAGVWAVAELALMLRKTREVIGDVGKQATNTVENLQPIITKADGMVGDLQPTLQEVPQLLEKVGNTVDMTTVSLASVNDILGDVHSVSGTAADATTAVNGAVRKVSGSAATAATGLVSRFSGKHVAQAPAEIAGQAAPALEEQVAEPAAEKADEPAGSGYVTYAQVTRESSEESASE